MGIGASTPPTATCTEIEPSETGSSSSSIVNNTATPEQATRKRPRFAAGPAIGIIIEKPPTYSRNNKKKKSRKRARPLIRTIALEAVTTHTEPLNDESAKERLRKLLSMAEQREVAFNKVIGEIADEWDEQAEEEEHQEEEEEEEEDEASSVPPDNKERRRSSSSTTAKRSRHSNE